MTRDSATGVWPADLRSILSDSEGMGVGGLTKEYGKVETVVPILAGEGSNPSNAV
jgi:hypothetical protein